jgi:hypothetical protein
MHAILLGTAAAASPEELWEARAQAHMHTLVTRTALMAYPADLEPLLHILVTKTAWEARAQPQMHEILSEPLLHTLLMVTASSQL